MDKVLSRCGATCRLSEPDCVGAEAPLIPVKQPVPVSQVENPTFVTHPQVDEILPCSDSVGVQPNLSPVQRPSAAPQSSPACAKAQAHPKDTLLSTDSPAPAVPLHHLSIVASALENQPQADAPMQQADKAKQEDAETPEASTNPHVEQKARDEDMQMHQESNPQQQVEGEQLDTAAVYSPVCASSSHWMENPMFDSGRKSESVQEAIKLGLVTSVPPVTLDKVCPYISEFSWHYCILAFPTQPVHNRVDCWHID